MANVDQAIKFCETLAKDKEFKKQYADANEFKMKDLLDMLREYKRIQERYGKYEYVCRLMPSDLYYELAEQYERECEEDDE
jgi:hypothetical protein